MAELEPSPHKGGISPDVRKVANLARAGVLHPWEFDHLLNALDAVTRSQAACPECDCATIADADSGECGCGCHDPEAPAREERAEARLDEAYRQGREHESYDRYGEIMDLRDRAERAEAELYG